MIWFALGSLLLWPVVVLYFFERWPIRKAIVLSYVCGWLFLPPVGIPLPGVPDWSKVVATSASVTVALLLKQPARFFAFRPRWYDWPTLLFCFCSIPTSIVAGFGLYEGVAAILDDATWWGMPYLIGRIYLNDRDGARELASGFAIGGLLYVPLCLFEMRFSPILKPLVYGVSNMSMSDFGRRYGGYRPSVFLAMGLEVGWWMCCSSFCAYVLLASKATRRWFDLPGVPLAWILAIVTVACRSTGALAQITIGAMTLSACRAAKTALPLYLVTLVAPMYCLARPTGYCSSEQVVSFLGQVFDRDRIDSVAYRLTEEEYLIGRAMLRPILGWSRMGSFNPLLENGQNTVIVDGFWIRTFCIKGGVGLLLINLMGSVPTILFVRRNPVRTWMQPDVAPLSALAIIVPLYMMDNLSNAMLNPVYALVMGLLSGCSARREIVPGPGRETDDDVEDDRLVRAIRQQARLTRARPRGRNVEDLASLHAQRGRSLSARGLGDLALAERSVAEDLWSSVEPPGGAGPWRAERAANANDLAWLLVNSLEAGPDRLAFARRLVESALAGEPNRAPYWNTLGIICYRLGDHHRAIHSLSRSVTLEADGGTAFDFYFLALANRALGYEAAAATWRDRAESWHREHPEMDEALAVIRAESYDATP